MILFTSFRRLGSLCLIGVLIEGAAVPVHGQVTLQRREADLATRLGPGDELRIAVADVDDIPDRPIRIDSAGQVDLPLVGTIQAAGLTPEQLRQALQARYTKYVTNPQVTVNVTTYESRPVSVLGAVARPGIYQMNSPKRLTDVLALAGGPSPDAGSTVIITRQSTRGDLVSPGLQTEHSTTSNTLRIPLDGLISATRPDHDILIDPDDVVTLPKGDVVYVLGNVHRAGGFSLASHPSLTVIQAVTLAEGFSSNAAASRARILRRVEPGTPAKEIKVDADRILQGKDPDQPLLANDILYIPNSALKAVSKRALEAAIGVTTAAVIYR